MLYLPWQFPVKIETIKQLVQIREVESFLFVILHILQLFMVWLQAEIKKKYTHNRGKLIFSIKLSHDIKP